MKKIFSFLVMSTLLLTCASAISMPVSEKNLTDKWGQIVSKEGVFIDELDQQQPDMDFFGPVGPCPLVTGVPNYILAQSFIPTKNILTRIELLIGKNSTTTFGYKAAIRDNLSGLDLVSLNVPAENITTENFSWVEFDFANIAVVPGNTYYIVSSTENVTDNWYAWGLKMNTTYPGTIFYSLDDEVTWAEEPGSDMTFKTYGVDNQAPSAPTVDGPLSGKVRVSLNYKFLSTDPDGDDVYYVVSWGCCENETHTYGPYPSGIEVTINHTYPKKGTYTLKANAKDIYSSESDWTTLEVKIPRYRNHILVELILQKLLFLNQFFN